MELIIIEYLYPVQQLQQVGLQSGVILIMILFL